MPDDVRPVHLSSRRRRRRRIPAALHRAAVVVGPNYGGAEFCESNLRVADHRVSHTSYGDTRRSMRRYEPPRYGPMRIL